MLPTGKIAFGPTINNTIFVNNRGERFVKEDGRRDELSAAVLEQPGSYYYKIVDAHTAEDELGGVTYTASAYEWFEVINNTPVEVTNVETKEQVEMVLPYSYDEEKAAERLHVLAALENTILQNYDFIPISANQSAQLKGMQVEYHTEEEVFPMGFGGIQYMTYNYTDAEWDAYVAEQGGTLNYN